MRIPEYYGILKENKAMNLKRILNSVIDFISCSLNMFGVRQLYQKSEK